MKTMNLFPYPYCQLQLINSVCVLVHFGRMADGNSILILSLGVFFLDSRFLVLLSVILQAKPEQGVSRFVFIRIEGTGSLAFFGVFWLVVMPGVLCRCIDVLALALFLILGGCAADSFAFQWLGRWDGSSPVRFMCTLSYLAGQALLGSFHIRREARNTAFMIYRSK